MGLAEDSPVLSSLFGEGVVARMYCGYADMPAVHPDELALVENAVEKRRKEFAAGRLCAKAALEALGINAAPLVCDAARAPLWPKGVVGSITHSGEFCGAVVAPRSTYAGIGIDAEHRGHVQRNLWSQILTSTELRDLERLPDSPALDLATTVFSAKEAFYKCQYQVTGAWLDFKDAEVSVADGCFRLRVLKDVPLLGSGRTFQGRFRCDDTYVFTGISITANLAGS